MPSRNASTCPQGFRTSGWRRTRRTALAAAFPSLLAAFGACGTNEEQVVGRDADAGRVLDGMEVQATSRSANESAREALQKRDLRQLKMVHYYVLHRAHEPLLGPAEVALLELGIWCIENGPATEARVEKAVSASKDARLARQVHITCLGTP
jgi:hypothetical protein